MIHLLELWDLSIHIPLKTLERVGMIVNRPYYDNHLTMVTLVFITNRRLISLTANLYITK